MKRLTEEQERFLNQLPAEYGDALSKYAYRFFGYQRHMLPAVEDAVQETFVRAVHEVECLLKHPNPLGWLLTVLRFVLLNQRRVMNRCREDLYGEETEILETTGTAMMDVLEHRESRVTLPEVMEQAEVILTRDEMATFVDHYLIGLTTEETALRENVSADTVRGRLSRIRKKMKKYFDTT